MAFTTDRTNLTVLKDHTVEQAISVLILHILITKKANIPVLMNGFFKFSVIPGKKINSDLLCIRQDYLNMTKKFWCYNGQPS
jgi:hypothetical protein